SYKDDSDCILGHICALSPPNKGSCIYFCHNNSDCFSSQCDQKTSQDYPHWLCTCKNDYDCYIPPDRSKAVCDLTHHCVGTRSKNMMCRGDDCTDFASQVLHAGGLPMDDQWWLKKKRLQADQVRPGDIVQYHNPSIGWHHSAIIVDGSFKVVYHSTNTCDNTDSALLKSNNNDRRRYL
ncbi:13084_t:CDS:2, partial [Cetraspora pellucida]